MAFRAQRSIAMRRWTGAGVQTLALVTGGTSLVATLAVARPGPPVQYATGGSDTDAIGDMVVTGPSSKVLQDTTWIADWSFDGGTCDDTGWVTWDNRVLNLHDDAEFWHVDNRFAGQGGVIVNNAAVLSKHDICWFQDGYGNDNDFSIIAKYTGAATLAFDKASDSEPGFDFVTVECDSLGLSEARADPSLNPRATSPAAYRLAILSTDGLDTGSRVGPLILADFGPGVHEAYIRFASDNGFSDQDGDYATWFQAGLVVDNIVVTGGMAYVEDFEGTLHANVTMVETANALPFLQAPWLRLHEHVTDNDKCVENPTCAWLGSDPTLPALQPSMAFGPGGAVVRNWLDDMLASPWVSLGSTPGATGTVLSFRNFLGTPSGSGIIHYRMVRARSKVDNSDTPAPGDSVDCVTPWDALVQFGMPDPFRWRTSVFDLTPHFPATAAQVQVGFRTVDLRYLTGAVYPTNLGPGPGPFVDRVRVGRRVLHGPVIAEGIDARTQAQDAFPTVVEPTIAPGEHHVPDGSNRFGTCAFSQGAELGLNSNSTRHITGDSIHLDSVVNALGPGRGIASVRVYGRIVAGPHAGKVPGPFVHAFSLPGGASGFFAINADSARNPAGNIVANRWFVDVNDDYFRGGDVLRYFWACADDGGGLSTMPHGITAAQFADGTISLAAAQSATGGLYEVNYLPTIEWDTGYLTAVAADDFGDVAPTPEQLANSNQKHCILYYQKHVSRRRSGDANRTSFMFTLDRLGYRDQYDVYDVQGYGNTVNQLVSRANVGQCTGYALVIQDDGRSIMTPNVPAGEDNDASELDQASWYRQYLASGVTSLAGTASLWLIGENTAFLHQANALFATEFGLGTVVTDQSVAINPIVHGTANFSFASGGIAYFTGDTFALNGGCPAIRAYDAVTVPGTATITHRYESASTQGAGAIAMNRNLAQRWNTVWMGFPWFDIRHGGAPISPSPQNVLAVKLLHHTVPRSIDPDGAGPLPAKACLPGLPHDGSTDVDPGHSGVDALPEVTTLHQNVPNPFNPTTKITFDLARDGRVELRVFDVAGRHVRTLVDAVLPAKRDHEAVWNGLDAAGNRVASGVYFYRLVTGDRVQTRKMALLE